jgi:hypothetical protein
MIFLSTKYLMKYGFTSLFCSIFSFVIVCPFVLLQFAGIWFLLWYLLVTPLVSSGYSFGIFWLLIWYLPVTPLVSSGYSFGIFWLRNQKPANWRPRSWQIEYTKGVTRSQQIEDTKEETGSRQIEDSKGVTRRYQRSNQKIPKE